MGLWTKRWELLGLGDGDLEILGEERRWLIRGGVTEIVLRESLRSSDGTDVSEPHLCRVVPGVWITAKTHHNGMEK